MPKQATTKTTDEDRDAASPVVEQAPPAAPEDTTPAEPEAATEEPTIEEPKFSVSRLLGADGSEIVNAAFDGAPPAHAGEHGIIAAALEGLGDDHDVTRPELRERIEQFLAHEETTTGGDD